MRRLLLLVLLTAACALLTACGSGDSRDGGGAGAQAGATPPRQGARGAAGGAATAAPARAARDPAADPLAHVRALARIAREHGGTRAAATPGARASEDYVAARLAGAGYTVRRQAVPFPFFAERRPPILRAGSTGVRARTMAYSPGGRAAGRVVAVGLACGAGAVAGLLRGAVALARRGTCPFRQKARVVQAAGAAAVLVADRGAEPVSATLGAPGLRIPALAVGAAAARALTRAGRASVRVDAVSELRVTRNVIGELPAGPHRTVMLGAHLDSVPAGPGINDNASGTAAVLAAAERLAARRVRGVRVVFWGAEELGLYGSRRYVASLSAAARRALVAYLNLDMVGSPGGRAEVYDTDDAIERVLRGALRRSGLRPGEERLGGSSDHASFARAGIPVGGVFTGLDRCYHRACDDGGNVDARLLRAVTRAVTDAARRLSKPS